MNLHRLFGRRLEAGQPVRVGLIGAGKFGSMFLAQMPSTRGIEVAAIAPHRGRHACRTVGWSDELVEATRFTDDAQAMLASPDIEVAVERPAKRRPASATLAAQSPKASCEWTSQTKRIVIGERWNRNAQCDHKVRRNATRSSTAWRELPSGRHQGCGAAGRPPMRARCAGSFGLRPNSNSPYVRRIF